MSHEWEQYRDRYAAERPETFDAYVDVWRRVPSARSQFGGWAIFSRMASAERQCLRDSPDRVRAAEAIMQVAGYAIGTPTRRGARRWIRKAETR